MTRGALPAALALLQVAVLACGSETRTDRLLAGGGPAGGGPAGGGPAVSGPAVSGPMVLVTLSGLRPDVVGALRGDAQWTPHIDAFAREADWVGTAVVASSAPAVSLVSLMTGVSPWQHQVLSHTGTPPRPGTAMLAQALGGAGYRATARVPLDYDLQIYGLLEGFDEVAEIEPIVEAAAALEALIDGPELLWLHLREANVAYRRRDVELPRLAERSAGLPWRIEAWRLLSYADPTVPMPAEERAAAWQLFCHEVAWADYQVGELLRALRESGQWDRAWVVLTATQGTELGEHDQALYAQNLGRETIEVPLIIKLPRSFRRSLAVPEGQRVSQIRLWATLIEAAGGRAAAVHAPSLFQPVDPPLVSELYQRNGTNEFSLVRGDLQLIWSTRFAPEEPEFYFAQLEVNGGRPPLTEPARAILDRLEQAFRRTAPLSGPIGGEIPALRLERWTEDGAVKVEDHVRARELAALLSRTWRRYVDRERTPEEESALSGSSR